MSIGDFPESLSQAMLVGCKVSRRIGHRPVPSRRNSRSEFLNYDALFIVVCVICDWFMFALFNHNINISTRNCNKK